MKHNSDPSCVQYKQACYVVFYLVVIVEVCLCFPGVLIRSSLYGMISDSALVFPLRHITLYTAGWQHALLKWPGWQHALLKWPGLLLEVHHGFGASVHEGRGSSCSTSEFSASSASEGPPREDQG